MNNKEFLDFLLNRFKIEREKFYGSGVYAYERATNGCRIKGYTSYPKMILSLKQMHFKGKAINY